MKRTVIVLINQIWISEAHMLKAISALLTPFASFLTHLFSLLVFVRNILIRNVNIGRSQLHCAPHIHEKLAHRIDTFRNAMNDHKIVKAWFRIKKNSINFLSCQMRGSLIYFFATVFNFCFVSTLLCCYERVCMICDASIYAFSVWGNNRGLSMSHFDWNHTQFLI